jgi:hypothetical protein
MGGRVKREIDITFLDVEHYRHTVYQSKQQSSVLIDQTDHSNDMTSSVYDETSRTKHG